MKDNAVYHVTKVITDNTRKKKVPQGVLKEQYVTLGYKEDSEKQRLKLRGITFRAEDGKTYVFITNNFALPASQVALIYKCRWMIEF